jgi:hypothetical protein
MALTKDLLEFPCMIDGGIIDRKANPQNDRQNVSHIGQGKSDYHYSFRYGEMVPVNQKVRNELVRSEVRTHDPLIDESSGV